MLNKKLAGFTLGLCMAFSAVSAEKAKKIKMAISYGDGAKYNLEFVNYSPESAFYKKQGIEAALFDLKKLTHGKINDLSLYSLLKKHHVIMLRTECSDIDTYTAQDKKNAKAVARALSMYVKNGGGLILQIEPTRYPNDEDELFWNECIKPFGLQLLHEGIHDPTNSTMVKIKHNSSKPMSYTKNLKAHPVTKGVKGLLLPLYGYDNFPATPAYKYSRDWKIVARAEKTAKSYKNGKLNNCFTPTKPGTYKSAPPVVAVRKFGKGRIVVIAINKLYTGMNFKNQYWGNQTENKGLSGKPSNAMQLFANAVKWAGAESVNNPALGTYKAPSCAKIKHPESISITGKFATPVTNSRKGIWGMHSNLTDGKGSVVDYVKAAKAAGLSFIVFTEPLELLSPKKLKKLIADCKDASNNKFYACPGVEFTDSAGNRWIVWGERVRWPVDTFKKGKYTYKQWGWQNNQSLRRLHNALRSYSHRAAGL